MYTLFPSQEDLNLRWNKIQQSLQQQEMDACVISSFVNIYYLTGKVFDGYIYFPVSGEPIYFVRRPQDFTDARMVKIRKPEDISILLQERDLSLPKNVAFEMDQMTHSDFVRLHAVFNPEKSGNATAILRMARMIKTPWEIEQLRYSAKKHSEVYAQIVSLFQAGMTDLEFQYEIEREMRKNGSIGLFRAFGGNMEIFMGSILAGANAETSSPCDFALGGGGAHACLPIGANNTLIEKGQSVMVDMAGNFTAYLTDMTRVFSYGKLPEKAYFAHQVSIEMHNWLMENAKPGFSCAEIYNHSLAMAENAGLSANFMGTVQQAKFVGHGVGLEINELPVLMGRSKDVLQPGMTIAFEPKFVLPRVGAVGNENTFLITDNGIEKLTLFEEEIIQL